MKAKRWRCTHLLWQSFNQFWSVYCIVRFGWLHKNQLSRRHKDRKGITHMCDCVLHVLRLNEERHSVNYVIISKCKKREMNTDVVDAFLNFHFNSDSEHISVYHFHDFQRIWFIHRRLCTCKWEWLRRKRNFQFMISMINIFALRRSKHSSIPQRFESVRWFSWLVFLAKFNVLPTASNNLWFADSNTAESFAEIFCNSSFSWHFISFGSKSTNGSGKNGIKLNLWSSRKCRQHSPYEKWTEQFHPAFVKITMCIHHFSCRQYSIELTIELGECVASPSPREIDSSFARFSAVIHFIFPFLFWQTSTMKPENHDDTSPVCCISMCAVTQWFDSVDTRRQDHRNHHRFGRVKVVILTIQTWIECSPRDLNGQ